MQKVVHWQQLRLNLTVVLVLRVCRLFPPSRLSTSVARPQVQVVTHLCYSDFQDIMKAVDDMDGEWTRF